MEERTEKYFSESHEWVCSKDGMATVGVTLHAQEQLGDIVYVELPKVGVRVLAGGEAAVLESTKAAADVYSPVSGTIIEVNTLLNDSPDLVNKDPEKSGWLFSLRLDDPSELTKLLTEDKYKAMIG